MITSWLLYALLVSALVSIGAAAVERLLATHRLPSRGVWVGALLLSFSLPAVRWVFSGLPSPPVNAEPEGAALSPVTLEPLLNAVGESSVARALEAPFLLAWLVATLSLLAGLVLLTYRIRRLRRGWRTGSHGERTVLISRRWGPAVVGFLQPRIVLPEWCWGLDTTDLDLILAHETEHMRAGDLQVILVSALLPVLIPWNALLWWQLHRLRLAVEGDCDLRVLKRRPQHRRAYLELLLEVGRRAAQRETLAAMLSEPAKGLERRIRTMTAPLPKNPWLRGIGLAAIGGVLIALACWVPEPTMVEEGPTAVEPQAPPAAMGRESGAVASPTMPAGNAQQEIREPADQVSAAPTFTPYTVRPDIVNRTEVVRALEAEYPPSLRDAGLGGTAQVWFFIDEAGTVQQVMIRESSGREALDEAALRVASMIRFTPALDGEEPVPVWIALPITFAVR